MRINCNKNREVARILNYNHIILLDYKINVMSKKNALKIWGGGGLYGDLIGGLFEGLQMLRSILKATLKAISEITVDPLGEKRVGRAAPKPVVAPDL